MSEASDGPAFTRLLLPEDDGPGWSEEIERYREAVARASKEGRTDPDALPPPPLSRRMLLRDDAGRVLALDPATGEWAETSRSPGEGAQELPLSAFGTVHDGAPPEDESGEFPGLDGTSEEYADWVEQEAIDLAKDQAVEISKDYVAQLLGEEALGFTLPSAAGVPVETAAGVGGWLGDQWGKLEQKAGEVLDKANDLIDHIDDPVYLLENGGLEHGLPLALDRGVDELMSAWEVGDDASAAEQVAKHYVEQLANHIQKALVEQLKNLENLAQKLEDLPDKVLDRIKQQFGGESGESSNAVLGVVRIGDKDDKVDVVKTGLPTVLVEGQPIARTGDLMAPSDKPILAGCIGVQAGALPVAPRTSVTAIPSTLASAAATVFVGAPDVLVLPPAGPAPPTTATRDPASPSPGGEGKDRPPERSASNSEVQPEKAGSLRHPDREEGSEEPEKAEADKGDGAEIGFPTAEMKDATHRLQSAARELQSKHDEIESRKELAEKERRRLQEAAIDHSLEIVGIPTMPKPSRFGDPALDDREKTLDPARRLRELREFEEYWREEEERLDAELLSYQQTYDGALRGLMTQVHRDEGWREIEKIVGKREAKRIYDEWSLEHGPNMCK